jgi:hypothetical protein
VYRKTVAREGVPDVGDRPLGGGVSDRMLAAIIALWLIALLLLPLAWASVRGFDATFCEAYQACDWRKA